MDDALVGRISNQIFKFEAQIEGANEQDGAFTLDYTRGNYRQDDLAGLIRDAAPYFALTADEIKQLDRSEVDRAAFTRIADAARTKKGDYGELLLFIILSIFYDAPKFVTKARLRSSTTEQIRGFDCAHFTVDQNVTTLWLGEAKFHQSMTTAISGAAQSLADHIENETYLRRELKLLGGEIEINKGTELYTQVKSYIDGGRSLDNIPIAVPVLLTYDSPFLQASEGVAGTDINSDDFKAQLAVELKEKFISINEKSWPTFSNIKIVFFLMPFQSVSDIKKKLEIIETGMKF